MNQPKNEWVISNYENQGSTIFEAHHSGAQIPFTVIVESFEDEIMISVGADLKLANAEAGEVDAFASMFVNSDVPGYPDEIGRHLKAWIDSEYPQYMNVGYTPKGSDTPVSMVTVKAEDEGVVIDCWKTDLDSTAAVLYSDMVTRNGPADGPWTIVSADDDNGDAVAYIASEGQNVAVVMKTVRGNGQNFDGLKSHDIANTNLIAQSYELMKCLEDVLSANGNVDDMDFDRYRDVLNKATSKTLNLPEVGRKHSI